MSDKYEYNEKTGLLTWKKGFMTVKAGDPVGSFSSKSGLLFRGTGKTKKHIAEIVLDMHGIQYEEGKVYHRNGCGIDNRLGNLVYDKIIVQGRQFIERNFNGTKWNVTIGQAPYKSFASIEHAIKHRNEAINKDKYFVEDTTISGTIRRLNAYAQMVKFYSPQTQDKVLEFIRDEAFKNKIMDILTVNTDELNRLAELMEAPSGDENISALILESLKTLRDPTKHEIAVYLNLTHKINNLVTIQIADKMISDGTLYELSKTGGIRVTT